MSELSLESRVESALKNPASNYEKDKASRRYSLGKACVSAQRYFGDTGIVDPRKITTAKNIITSENPDDLFDMLEIFTDLTGQETYWPWDFKLVVEHEKEHGLAAQEARAKKVVYGLAVCVDFVYIKAKKCYAPKDNFRRRISGAFMDFESGPMSNLARASIHAAPTKLSTGDLDTLTSFGYPDIGNLAQRIRAWNAANPDDSLFVPLSASEPMAEPQIAQ